MDSVISSLDASTDTYQGVFAAEVPWGLDMWNMAFDNSGNLYATGNMGFLGKIGPDGQVAGRRMIIGNLNGIVVVDSGVGPSPPPDGPSPPPGVPSSVPEIDPASFGSVLMLVLGAFGLAERKRRRLIS